MRAIVSGAGSVAVVSACIGLPKEVRLDAATETADILCDPVTGRITVRAVRAVAQIQLRAQLANGAWQQFALKTAQAMSIGSPAAASADNTEPIDVQILQVDPAGEEVPGHGRARQLGVALDEIAHLLDVGGLIQGQEIDHAEIAAALELAVGVEDVGDTTLHSCAEVAPRQPQHHDAASGLHDRTRIGVNGGGDYVSVDCGKLTTAPLFAVEAVDVVLHQQPRASVV